MDVTRFGVTGAASRRRFIRTVGLGGVAAAAPLAGRSAHAAGGVRAATTIPKRPVAGDVPLLVQAHSAELAASALYSGVEGRITDRSLAVDTSVGDLLIAIREHHTLYAQALGSLLAKDASVAADDGVEALVADAFASGDGPEVIAAATSLEGALAATHGALISGLVGTDGAALLASIVSIEARHATTLTAIGGSDAFPPSGLLDLSSAISSGAA